MTSSSSTAVPDERGSFAVLVPVKRTAVAKSRLRPLGDGPRRELAAAFAADAVGAALGCPAVARVMVVTDDLDVARVARGLGADVIPDGADDLNGTLVQAAAELHRRTPALRLAAVCADVPALRPEELAAALAASRADTMSFVSDQERVGTTAVMSPTLTEFRPAFGQGSRREHLDAGAFEVDGIDVPGLRRDVDDPADLAEAWQLGLGPRTAAVAATLLPERLQATVSAFDEDTRTGRVLLDDGRQLDLPAAAFESSRLRLLRRGQRVRVDTVTAAGAVQVVAVQIYTLA
jgi:2-phospho-L-lactate guanylyltransferase